MAEIRVALTTSDGPRQVDLMEWLTARGISAYASADDSAMGTAETVTMIVSGAAGLRGGLLVLREWIKGRRTTVKVKTRRGLEFEVTSSTSDEALTDLIKQIQADTGFEGDTNG